MNALFRNRALALCAALISCAVQEGLSADFNASSQKLEGTWAVTVTRVNPPPSLPPTFPSLMSFLSNGVVLETSGTGRTNRGPAFGEWVRTGDRQFTTTFYLFRFGSGEVFAGVTKIIRNMEVGENLETFRAVSVQEQYDVDGKLTATLQATEEGRRLKMGEIGDKP